MTKIKFGPQKSEHNVRIQIPNVVILDFDNVRYFIEKTWGTCQLGRKLFCILPVLVEVEVRPTHYQQPRQNMDEDPTDPRRHRVRLRRPKMNVQNHHGHAYTESRETNN